MGFGEFKDRLRDLGKEHGDKIEQGLDKAAEAAKEKFGHEDQIDKAAEKGKEFLDGNEPGAGEQR
ncbi:antitoxin [Saccharopolyspora sp. NPDC050389]|uniref:antitoxin n=1 Tax=Saccharopolyspora sp. NPDC050389 TaxID=3155516 RepID=UPI0033DF25A2